MSEKTGIRMSATLAGLALMLGMSACGSGGTETGAPESGASTGAAPDVSGLLMQAGEEKGWSPDGNVDTVTGLDEYVKEFMLDPDSDAERLADAGLVSFTVDFTTQEKGEGSGVSNIVVYESEDGAQSELDYEAAGLEKNYPNLERFDVPDVPGAVGWTGHEGDQDAFYNVIWREGSCVMTLGNQGPGDLEKSLTGGVQAIHSRVNGECP